MAVVGSDAFRHKRGAFIGERHLGAGNDSSAAIFHRAANSATINLRRGRQRNTKVKSKGRRRCQYPERHRVYFHGATPFGLAACEHRSALLRKPSAWMCAPGWTRK